MSEREIDFEQGAKVINHYNRYMKQEGALMCQKLLSDTRGVWRTYFSDLLKKMDPWRKLLFEKLTQDKESDLKEERDSSVENDKKK